MLLESPAALLIVSCGPGTNCEGELLTASSLNEYSDTKT